MNDFFNLIGDFFQNRPLTNEEQILLGILALLLFLLGYLVGWLIQRSSTKRYKRELLLVSKDRDEYEARYRATEAKQKTLAQELETTSREKVDTLDQLQAVRRQLAANEQQTAELRSRNEELTATNQSYVSTIDSLNDQVIGLKTQNEQLLADAAAREPGEGPVRSQEEPGSGNDYPRGDSLNTFIATTEARFQLFAERLEAMAEENARLRARQADRGTISPPKTEPSAPARPDNPYTGHQPQIDPSLSGSATRTEPLVIRADTTAPGTRTGNQGEAEVIVQTMPSIQVPPMTTPDENDKKDDLTLIDNIGTFLQNELHKADIYRFEQIASWTPADIATYTELIGYIPGIIERDDWVGQAKALSMSEAAYDSPLSSKRKDENDDAQDEGEVPGQAETAAEANEREDDLKIVEGIGPKIETILKASGILTLDQLADSDPEKLREVLDGAGSRFRSHDPKTWPVQAGLAADGKIDQLKAWQEELNGGK